MMYSHRKLFFLLLYILLLSNSYSQSNINLNDSDNLSINKSIQPKDSFDLQDYEIIYDTVYITGDTIHKKDTIRISVPKENAISYLADFSYSAFYSFAKMESRTEDFLEYAFKRQQAQKPLLSYTISGSFMVQKQDHSVSIGLGISGFREKQDYHSSSWVNYKTSYLKLDTIDAYYVIRNTDTSWVFVTKENQYERSDSVLEKNLYKNQLLYFQIPIIYGYYKNYRKFSLYYRTGLVLDLLMSASGKTMSPENNNEFKFIERKNYNKINISLWVGVVLKFPLYNQFSLIIEPHYIKGLTSIYNLNYSITQKQQSFGIKSGLVYLF